MGYQPTEEQLAAQRAKMDPERLREVEKANRLMMDHLKIVAHSKKPVGYYEKKWRDHQFNKLRLEYPYERRENYPELFPEDAELQAKVQAKKEELEEANRKKEEEIGS